MIERKKRGRAEMMSTMRTRIQVSGWAVALVIAAIAGDDQTWTFDNADPGPVPEGWIAGVTGARQGDGPEWKIIRDGERSVLAQLSSGGANGDFPVCLRQGTRFRDGTVTIRFKPISGKIDQAGGVVFRARDKDNFYIVRANALEDNVSCYCTRDGRRKTIKYWQDIEVARGQWHVLKVVVDGFHFEVWLDGKKVGTIEDENHTFPDAGMVGFWTKADSVTWFDKLTISTNDDDAGDGDDDGRLR